MTAVEGVEIWRGGVNPWDCDQMGHMNVRVYVAAAMEGLAGLASAIGLAGAFHERADATLLVRDHHIRFLREARCGAPLHMVGGVVEIGDCEARFLQLLFHSRDGALAATFQTRVVHATGRDERPFPWAAQTRRLAEGLRIDPPAEAAPRGLPAALDAGLAGLAAADRMGLVPIAAGAFKAAEADVFGRVRPDAFMGRISDGMPAFDAALQADDDSPLRPPGIGAATLEFRLGYQAWPRPGDRFVIRTGLAAIEARTRRMAHWILDPRSGGVWAVAQAVDVDLDLTARKSAPFAPDELARLRARVTPGLSG